jgi:hypothetical protein
MFVAGEESSQGAGPQVDEEIPALEAKNIVELLSAPSPRPHLQISTSLHFLFPDLELGPIWDSWLTVAHHVTSGSKASMCDAGLGGHLLELQSKVSCVLPKIVLFYLQQSLGRRG